MFKDSMKGQPVHFDFSLLAASKTCNTKEFYDDTKLFLCSMTREAL